MGNLKAELDSYDAMIRALQKFNQDILQSAEALKQEGNICQIAMGSDTISANCIEQLNEAVKKYRNVTLKATDLQGKLLRKRNEIWDIIIKSKQGG